MELSPDGAGYRLNTRFARFVNVPELMQQFRQMADIQTSETLQVACTQAVARKTNCHQRPGHARVESICRLFGEAGGAT